MLEGGAERCTVNAHMKAGWKDETCMVGAEMKGASGEGGGETGK